MRFAAVDIGSNAVRLLFTEVTKINKGSPFFKKLNLIRLPIRLGEDAFCNQLISPTNEDKLIRSIHVFSHLLEVYEVKNYRACATSAMREAKNGSQIIQDIFEQTGVNVEIIEGRTEAHLIYSNHVEHMLDDEGSYLYTDVGGGSTEMTVFCEGVEVMAESFDIGTLRLKDELISSKSWSDMKKWIEKAKAKYEPEMLIGTGGNINRLYKLCGLKDYALLSKKRLNETYEYLNSYTLEQRITKLGLRPDRADVIVPAAEIFLFILKNAGIKNIFVPKIGLADGIVHELFNEQVKSTKQKTN